MRQFVCKGRDSPASDWLGNSEPVPPLDVPRSGVISAEYSNRDALRTREAAEAFAIFSRLAVHHSNLRQFLAIALADIESDKNAFQTARCKMAAAISSCCWITCVKSCTAEKMRSNNSAGVRAHPASQMEVKRSVPKSS